MQPTTGALPNNPQVLERQRPFSFSRKHHAQQKASTAQLQNRPDIIPLSDQDREVIAEMKDTFWPKSGFRFADSRPQESQNIEVLIEQASTKRKKIKPLDNHAYFKVLVCKIVLMVARFFDSCLRNFKN